MNDGNGPSLGELITLVRGNTYKSRLLGNSGPILLGLASIERHGGFRTDKLRRYAGPSKPEHLIGTGELFVSLKDVTQSAELLGAVAMVPKSVDVGRLTQDTVHLKMNCTEPSKSFIYWSLRTPQYRRYCLACSMGTTNLSLSRKDFLGWKLPEVNLFSLTIVALLEDLESKIDLLKRQNKTLEGMAEALFRQWFIEEAQDDWEEVELRDIAEVVDCLHSKKPEEVSDPYGVLLQVFNISSDGSIDLNKRYGVSETDFQNWTKRVVVQYGDIIISKTGRVGARGWVHLHNMFGIGRNLVVLRAFDSRNMIFLRGLMMSSFMDRVITENTSDGTILQSLHVKSIERIAFRMPPRETIDLIDSALRPIVERISVNLNEITTLSSQRDTLLPKLMSGEVRVNLD